MKILGTKIHKIIKKVLKDGQKVPDVQPNQRDHAEHNDDYQLNNPDNIDNANKRGRTFENETSNIMYDVLNT